MAADPAECAMCMEPMALPCKLVTCGHTFCMRCILQLGPNRVACPKCRATSDAVFTPIAHRDFWDVCKARPVHEVLDPDDLPWENFRRMYALLARYKRIKALGIDTRVPIARMRRVHDLALGTEMTDTLERFEQQRTEAMDRARQLRDDAKREDERARRAKLQLDTYFATVA